MTPQLLNSIVSNEPGIRQTQLGSVNAIALANGLLRLTLVPELGGKIASLVRLESGHEYLLQPSDPGRAFQPASYGGKFEDSQPSGFDECVPTVAECLYPEGPFPASKLPDHGDIWCSPASIEIAGEQIRLTSFLTSLPLRFRRTVQLKGNIVRLDYEATNLSSSRMRFLWSAHPLLSVEPGAEIILPPEVSEVEVGWSKDERLGKPGERCSWPKATDCVGRTVAVNKIVSASAGAAEKLFTPRVGEGFCGLFLPRKNESIEFRFDPRPVPYIGIWICQGGWPSDGTKQFTVALEPCNGRPDSLKEAIVRDECATLCGYESLQWWIEIEVNNGPPRLQV